MAQKLPKMAQKLAPAKKIAEIYLQYLQLFASLGKPPTKKRKKFGTIDPNVGGWGQLVTNFYKSLFL